MNRHALIAFGCAMSLMLGGCMGNVAAKSEAFANTLGAVQEYTANCYIRSKLVLVPMMFTAVPMYEHVRICNPELRPADDE